MAEHQSGVQAAGKGIVIKILPDDNDGQSYQRFTLRLPSGQTVLVAYHIELASRISALRKGDVAAFNGE